MKAQPLDYYRTRYATSRLSEYLGRYYAETGKQDEDFLFIEPYSIGDCVHSLGLLPAFRKAYCREGQRILFLCQKRAVPLQHVLPFADAFFGLDLGPDELALEYIAATAPLLTPGWPIICPPDMHNGGQLLRGGLGPIHSRKAIFHLRQDEPFYGPVISPLLRDATSTKLLQLGVVPGCSVIIFPHAITMWDFGPDYWARVVEGLREARPEVEVFTDTGPGIAPIRGTTGLPLELPEVVPAIEFAGSGVFLRSGLADLTAFADAMVICLTPPAQLYRFAGQEVPQEAFFIRNWCPQTKALDFAIKGREEADAQLLVSLLTTHLPPHRRKPMRASHPTPLSGVPDPR